MVFDHLAYSREYRKKNREKLYKQKAAYEARVRERLYVMLGDRCARCGFSDKRALQIDHISGDGYKEKRKYRGSSGHHRRVCESIQRGEKRYQILCANCNWIKRSEQNEHTRYVPHKTPCIHGVSGSSCEVLSRRMSDTSSKLSGTT